MSNNLRHNIIKLAHEHPEFRGDLLPLLSGQRRTAGYVPLALVSAAKAVAAMDLQTPLTTEEVGNLVLLYEILGTLTYKLNQGKMKGMLREVYLKTEHSRDILGAIWDSLRPIPSSFDPTEPI